MKSKILVVVVFLLVLSGLGYWWMMMPKTSESDDLVPEEDPIIVENVTTSEDWILVTVPSVLQESSYTLSLELTQSFENIDVVWSHPSNIQSDVYTLTEFVPGTSQAEYRIDVTLGNLLPGVNTYEIFGRSEDQEPGEGQSTTVSLEYSLAGLEELDPDRISWSNYFRNLDAQEYELTGVVGEGVDSIRVTSFHPESGKATFARLRQFSAGDEFVRYVMGEDLGNLFYGENEYVLEAYGDDQSLVSRKLFQVRSDYLSLQAQVQQVFGNFSKNERGWYISENLPWFSLRLVPENFIFEPDDQSVVMPRPTLLYPLMASPETPLCDFLSSLDYEQENYSYRGYSFETCQQYRFGVAVYDRFLSLLKFDPLRVVRRVEYESISDLASSAFVMIETGGIPSERSEDLSFEDLIPSASSDDEETVDASEESDQTTSPEDSTESNDANDEEEETRYYLFQMLITDDVEYTERKIGEIEVEGSDERIAAIVDIKELLTAHGGDAMFTEMLFTGANAIDPVKDLSESDTQRSEE